MKPCDVVQSQLLEHLYGLLESADAQAIEDHLPSCSPCQAALARAREQKQLLAVAAKAEFPQVKFAPPAEPPAAGTRAGVAALVRWAMAASILLIVLGVGSAWLWQHQQRESLDAGQQRLAELADQLNRKSSEYDLLLTRTAEHLDELAKQQNKVFVSYTENVQKMQQEYWQWRPDALDMTVSGPKVLQAGAVNHFQITTRRLDQRPMPAQLTAQVIDESQQVVFKKEAETKNGVLDLTLPIDLPVKPNSNLVLEISAKAKNGAAGTISQKLPLLSALYFTHLATDKPMYQPGETVHFRSLTLDRAGLTPTNEELFLNFSITDPLGNEIFSIGGVNYVVKDAAGEPVLGPDGKPVRGLGVGQFVIPPDANGGEYTLQVSELSNRFQPQERKFLVNRYEKPRLNKELEFTGKSYGPGDTVVAACKVARAEGGVPVADQEVRASIIIDGKRFNAEGKESGEPILLRTNAEGTVKVQFQLPASMERGIGTLSVNFTDGASSETITRPIPIVLNKLFVDFFPEGGDLIAGAPNRVYFQARTTLDKPAELQGKIVDESGAAVAEVKTFNDPDHPGANQGMGAFTFTPQPGKKYELKIDAPVGIEGKHPLPKSKTEGVVLNIPKGTVSDAEPVRVVIHSVGADRSLLVGAYCRGRMVTHHRLEVKAGRPAEVALLPEAGMGGVYRVTVFEERKQGETSQLVPRAERLTYRFPAEKLDLAVKPDKTAYSPGDRVKLEFAARDEKDRPAPAILMAAVVDKSVLKLADEKTYRSMPTHFFLTTEVRKPDDLEHADFLLSPHDSASVALDLLLGVQGWRRFAEQDPKQFREKEGVEADRLLVLNGNFPLHMGKDEFFQQELKNAEAELQASFEKIHEETLQQFQAAVQQRQSLAQEIKNVQQDALAIQENVQSRRDALAGFLTFARNVGLPGLAGICLFLGVVVLFRGFLLLRRGGAVPAFVGALCFLILFGGAMAVLVDPRGQQLLNEPPLVKADLVFAADPLSVPQAPAAIGKEEKMPLETDKLALAEAFKAAPDDGQRALRTFAEKKATQVVPTGIGQALGQGPGQGRGLDEQQMAMPFQAQPRGGFQEFARRALDFGDMGQPRFGAAMPMRGAPPPMVPAVPEAMPMEDAAPQLKREAPDAKDNRMRDRAERMQEGELAKPAEDREMRDRAPLAMPDLPAEQPMAGRAAPGRGRRDQQGQGQAPGFAQPGAPQAEAKPAPALPDLPPPVPFVVREYAHQRTFGESDIRHEAVETLFWHPVLVLPDGKAEASFELTDSVTTFQVILAGHTLDGRIGAATGEIESRLPLTLEPKLPIEVTAGDRIIVPLSVANNTDEKRDVFVRVQPTNLSLSGADRDTLVLDPQQRARKLYYVQPSIVEGEARLQFDGRSGPIPDSKLGTFKIVPAGFPITVSKSDVLENVAQAEILLPETWMKGTLKFQVSAHPSTLADLQNGLEALLREPHGCFEQTSTSNYPNLLILDYLETSDQANPEVAKRAKALLANGYQKLLSFECLDEQQKKRQGYEWFGGTAPAHEALTAYGLLQFRDMARVHDVDPVMVERTRAYLMSRRDGKGGFLRNPRALDSFGAAPDHITNAYIVWALTESGKEDDVVRELNAVHELAKKSNDPYFLALVANSLLNRDRPDDALPLLKKLAEAQHKDGSLKGAETSITRSGGRDLEIETTALALYAWLKANRPAEFNPNVQAAVKWIGQQRGGYGGFGSTQSTILALKALIAHAKANKKTANAGELIVYIGDQEIGRQPFPAGAEEAIVVSLADPEAHLTPGPNMVRVEVTGDNSFPFTVACTYRSEKPATPDGCPVILHTSLDRQDAHEGDTVRLTAVVENKSGKGQGMTVAIIGLPAGLTLPEDMKQLKDHARLRNDDTEPGLISAFETRGREIILYWRDLAPDARIEVPIDLICRVPGTFKGPASRSYLYYNADLKFWVDPLEMTITPKGE